jgi:bifunctional non-homologous end joining protein LigD
MKADRNRPPQRSDEWVKVKLSPRQQFVVGGYRANFDSILLGYYERRQLLYASKARAGFTPHSASKKSHRGEGITAADMAALQWVKPETVVDVAFVEWTDDGLLRHAEFVGLRDDKRQRGSGESAGHHADESSGTAIGREVRGQAGGSRAPAPRPLMVPIVFGACCGSCFSSAGGACAVGAV